MAPHINECGFNNFHESTSIISSGNQSLNNLNNLKNVKTQNLRKKEQILSNLLHIHEKKAIFLTLGNKFD